MSSTLREGSVPAKGPNLLLFEKYPRSLGTRANPHQNDKARSGDFLTSGNFGWLSNLLIELLELPAMR